MEGEEVSALYPADCNSKRHDASAEDDSVLAAYLESSERAREAKETEERVFVSFFLGAPFPLEKAIR
jgi:hypothetical protein